jgi:hypothetical protein
VRVHIDDRLILDRAIDDGGDIGNGKRRGRG